MLELGERERVVVDAEVDDARARSRPPATPRAAGRAPRRARRRRRLVHAAQVGHQRVVGVEHERRAARPRGHDRRPAVGDRLQLAVAVELVAEQVAEQHRARLELLDDRAEPELVDLEEAEVARQRAPAAAAGVGQRAGDPARHVRPGAVVDEPRAGALEDARHHRRGRRLAVGGADHDAAAVQPAREPADRVRLDAREHLARQRRPAAAPGRPRERADRLRGGHTCGQAHHRGATTRSEPGQRAHRHRQVGDRVAVGVGGERPLGLEGHLAALHQPDRGVLQVRALEHPRQPAHVADLRLRGDQHDVEQAVVEARVGREVHPAAEDAGVADRDGVAVEGRRLAVERELPRRGRQETIARSTPYV